MSDILQYRFPLNVALSHDQFCPFDFCVVFAELHLILLNNQSCLTANMHADCTSFSLQKMLNIIKLFCLIQIIR